MLYVPYTPLFGKYRITFYEPNQVQFITFYEPNQYKFVTFYEPNHPILTLVPYENEYIHQMPTHIAICVRAADGERIRPVFQVAANPNLADGLVSRERKSSAASSPPSRAAASASLGTRLRSACSLPYWSRTPARGGYASRLVFTSPIRFPFRRLLYHKPSAAGTTTGLCKVRG